MWLSARPISAAGDGSRTREFRAKPWENVDISAKYFGVIDRGVPTAVVNSSGVTTTQLISQGGHSSQFELDAQLHGGWRAVADLNQLSSLTFQLVFSPTFGEAVRSEVRSSAFLTNNFRGFSVESGYHEPRKLRERPAASLGELAWSAGGALWFGGSGALGAAADLFWRGCLCRRRTSQR